MLVLFFISNFRRILNAVCFLLGNFPASEFICRRFGTLFHLHRRVGMKNIPHTYLPMKMEQCSETSAYKIQTPGNYPEKKHTMLVLWEVKTKKFGRFPIDAARCVSIHMLYIGSACNTSLSGRRSVTLLTETGS